MKTKILFIIILFLVISGCTSSKNKIYKKIRNNNFGHVSLVAVGDNLIHESVYQAAQIGDVYDFKPMLKEIKPYIKNFDLKFINQEAIIGGKELGLSTYPCFNSPYELGDALIDVGFNLISMANNHTLDRGEKAVLNSIKYWESQSVIYSGASDKNISQVKLFTLNNIKFAFVAYTYGTNGIPHPYGKEYLANIYSDEKAKKDISKIKSLVDIIIVSMHWGDEYEYYPNNIQKAQADYLSSLGVHIIIGHHPHVIQPIDLIEKNHQKTIVVYSLGNFLSDQQGIDRLIGMAFSIDIYKKIENGKEVIEIMNPQAKLLYRYKDYTKNTFNIKLFQDLNNNFLKDYELYFEEKKYLIKTYYPLIEVS